jgi:biotin carboxyl carrier protein
VIVEVEVGGRVRRVELNRSPNEWAVTIDGRSVAVNLAHSGEWSSMVLAPADGGRHDGDRPFASYEIGFDDHGRAELIVHVDGAAIPVSLVDPRRKFGRGADEHRHGGGPAAIVAPMPGRVVKVLVKRGDRVTARQGLVVVEAMKMENELRAPTDGRVSDVRVTEGMSVDARAVLIVLE